MSKEKFDRAKSQLFEGDIILVQPRQAPSDSSSGSQSPPATSSNAPPASTPPPNGGGGGNNPPPPTSSSSSSSSSTSSSSSSSTSSESTPSPPSSSSSSTNPPSGGPSTSSNASPSVTPPPSSSNVTVPQSMSTSTVITFFTTNAQGVVVTTTSVSSGFVPVQTNHVSNASSNPPTATIVGASVGGAVGLILLAFVVAFCIRRKRNNNWKDEFDGNFDPDRTTPALYATNRYRDDPEPPPRPSRDELRQSSFSQPVTPPGDIGAVRVEPFVLPGRGAVSPPHPGNGAVGPYPQQQYLDSRGPYAQQQPTQYQPQGYYPPQQQYRPAHNTSLSASTVTHHTGSSDAGSGTYLLDTAGGAALSTARTAKEREALAAARNASTTSGTSAYSYPSNIPMPGSAPTPAVGSASLQSGSGTSTKLSQAQATYPDVNPYVVANPTPNPPPSPPLPTGSPTPATQFGYAGPLRVANPSRQDSGHSTLNVANNRPASPNRSTSAGVLVHQDGGRVPNLESGRVDEIPPTYDSIRR